MNQKVLLKERWAFSRFIPGEPEEILLGFSAKKKIFSGESPYQTIEIFDTVGFGRILFLDGLVQLSSKYEAVYHEMLVHPALFAQSAPQKVLIIGGGDGGALREVLKHPVKEVVMIEIDKAVVDISRKYLPSVSQGAFDDPRLVLKIADGAFAIKKYQKYFDCIILDSNDPENVALPLFQKKFFADVKTALKPKGIFAAQTGYFSERYGKKMREEIRSLFPFFQVHRAYVRSFPEDEHSFSFASQELDFSKYTEKEIARIFIKRNIITSYYSPSMHRATKTFPISFE